jgi:hypothetical protein
MFVRSQRIALEQQQVPWRVSIASVLLRGIIDFPAIFTIFSAFWIIQNILV